MPSAWVSVIPIAVAGSVVEIERHRPQPLVGPAAFGGLGVHAVAVHVEVDPAGGGQQ